MNEHFDAVVVGSGFGGAVTAYRLAEAGRRVCLLERGKPYPPDSFPRSPLGVKSQFWDPSAGLHGMFNLWSFEDIDAVCASGLGGGSLIYANVLLRKDERWFVREEPGHGSWQGRARALARHARRPRPALRPGRADDRRAALPARPAAVRRARARRSPSATRPTSSGSTGSSSRSP